MHRAIRRGGGASDATEVKRINSVHVNGAECKLKLKKIDWIWQYGGHYIRHYNPKARVTKRLRL